VADENRLVLFNRPEWSDKGTLVAADNSLHEVFALVLDQAVDGADIRISMSGWDTPDSQIDTEIVLQSLRNAVERGCNVRVVAPVVWTNPDPTDPENRPMWFNIPDDSALKLALDELLGDNIRYFRSGNKLVNNINHTKIFLVDSARGNAINGDFVVATASCNLRRRDLHRTNEMALFLGDPGLYMAFENYWEAIWRASVRQEPTFYGEIYSDPSVGIRVFFLPFFDQGMPPLDPGGDQDPVLNLLSLIEPGPGVSVRVAMATWTMGGRGGVIANRLVELAEQGCDVRVIGHAETGFFEIMEDWKNCPLDPWTQEPDYSNNIGKCETSQGVWDAFHGIVPWAKSQMHTKFVMVDGPLRRGGSVQNQRVVIGGTMNFSTPIWFQEKGMTEIVLEYVDQPDIWNAYREVWNWLCRQAWHSWGSPEGPLI
jgi:phosphatidylserine/phosphatidylglycerophosphate/cardiolipin synthase-like enzyme